MAASVKALPAISWDVVGDALAARMRGAVGTGERGSASIRGTVEFTGTTVDTALDYLRNGWRDGVRAAEAAMTATPVATEAATWEMDVAGFMPVVPAYLSGDPCCMLTPAVGETMRPMVQLVTNAAYSWRIDAKEVMVYAAALATIIAELDASGIDAALDVVDSARDGAKACMQRITVRAFGEPSDLSRLVMVFHPAFLRRGLFAVRELNDYWPQDMAIGTYGTCIDIKEEHREALGLDAAAAILPSVGDCRGLLRDDRLPELIEFLRKSIKGIQS